MLTRTTLAMALVFSIGACKKDDKAAKDEPEPTAKTPADKPADKPNTKVADKPADKPAAAPATIAIKAFKITINGSGMKDGKKYKTTMIVSMDDKGVVSAEGDTPVEKKEKTVVGTMTADGKLSDKDGKVLLTMAADGTVTPSAGGAKGKITVDDKGTISMDGAPVITIGEDGTIKFEKGQSETAKFEGDAAARQAGALAVIAMMMPGEMKDESAGVKKADKKADEPAVKAK